MTPASQVEKGIKDMIVAFMAMKEWPDVLIDIDHIDHYTNQVFVTSVGEWTEDRRRELQVFLRSEFPKIGISTIIYG